MPTEEAGLIFVGVDWAEAHHEVCVLDQAGAVLGHCRVPDGVAGLAQLHGLVADQASEPAEVVVRAPAKSRFVLICLMTQVVARRHATTWPAGAAAR